MNETMWMREQLETGKTAEVIAYLKGLEQMYADEAEEREFGRLVLEDQQLRHQLEETPW
jgi:hypothetical protein